MSYLKMQIATRKVKGKEGISVEGIPCKCCWMLLPEYFVFGMRNCVESFV